YAIRSSSTTSSKAIRALGQRHRRCSTTSYSGAPGPKPKGISTLVPANCAVHPPPAQRRITVGRLTLPFGRWRASLRARADAGVLLLVFMTAICTRYADVCQPEACLDAQQLAEQTRIRDHQSSDECGQAKTSTMSLRRMGKRIAPSCVGLS